MIQPNLSSKWSRPASRHMALIWSDAVKNPQGKSPMVDYRWNQMRVTTRQLL